MRRKAFTLVELLVVVSVITLLIALMLPTMRKSVQAARTAVCFSNMRQVTIGVAGYVSDYASMLPYSGRNYPQMSVLDIYEVPGMVSDRRYLHCPNDQNNPGYWPACWKLNYKTDMKAGDHPTSTAGPVDAIVDYSYYWQTKMYRIAQTVTLHAWRYDAVRFPSRLIELHCRGEMGLVTNVAGYGDAGGETPPSPTATSAPTAGIRST